MTFHLQNNATPDALSARTTTMLRLVMAVSLAAACFMAWAQTPAFEADAEAEVAVAVGEFGDLDLDQLERAFWACDHAASTHGVDGQTGMACGNATEQLKQRRFGGDFEAMLAWWREHKTAMHGALDQAEKRAQEQNGDATAQADDYPMP